LLSFNDPICRCCRLHCGIDRYPSIVVNIFWTPAGSFFMLVSWSVDLHWAYEFMPLCPLIVAARTIAFLFTAKDLYTGCQPVFVPTSSVLDLRGIIC
jgi:hypothetical protein